MLATHLETAQRRSIRFDRYVPTICILTSIEMSRSDNGFTLTRPGSTARVKRPNLVTKPTVPCCTGRYGFGQITQHGIAPQVPMIAPRLLIMVPYHPWLPASS